MRYFGLYNANRRLVQTYGPEYGIRLRSKVCEYTEVTVLIPYSGTLPGKDDNPNV
jgi:LytS/YehU family sensor histidine kinase